LDFIKGGYQIMFGKWSVVLKVSDSEVYYSLVQGEHPEAVFVGNKKQCLKYIRDVSGGNE
jgi:hypothetical protein